MARNIIVTPLSHRSIEEREVEMCERKGIGHPDTIVDGVCEAASRELSLAYLRTYGTVLHHNLDKGLLVAGRSVPLFGGGQVVEPIKIVICGRATRLDGETDAANLVTEAAWRYVGQHVRCDPERFTITTEIKEGSANLKEVFARGGPAALANDTSFGCGYAPYSRLEEAVLAASRLLTSPDFLERFPAAGDDLKIMGHRLNHGMHLTIALAFVDRYVEGVEHYFTIKNAMIEYLGDHLGVPVAVRMNSLDDPAARDENGVYLTVTGLSAEMGDDGQVGRGNRVNGLITPGRDMSLEAAAGKNPTSHVGKIYNVLAMLMARDIHQRLDGVDEVNVKLLSAIGERTDQPQVAAIEVGSKRGLTDEVRKNATAIADEWLENINRVTSLILEEKVALY
ncbi:MAG: methionine adenosyltransferase [Nitrospirae bacterium]|nr:methionine adenosyltransferase [Nitrospirota bacterium]